MTIGDGVGGAAPDEAAARALWSVDLGLRAGHGIHLDARGRWLVATRTTLASVEPSGHRRWAVGTLGEGQPPVLARDGSILRVEGDLVVNRDADSGEPVRSFSAPRAARLTVDPWGGLLYSEANPGGAAMLRCTSMTGAHRWSRPLDGSAHLTFAPTQVGDTAVAQYGGLLRALDSNGAVRWLAGHKGFRGLDRSAEEVSAQEADEMWTAVRPVNATTLLAGLRWHTGRGLFLVDVAARTVKPFADWFMPEAPVSVTPSPEAAFRVAVQGPQYEVRQMDWQWSVVMLDRAGSPTWEHRLHAPPLRMVPGANNTLIVSGTPSPQRWADYHRWQDLSKDSYVRCLAADGTERWTWYGPGPFTNLPIVGPDGVIYVGAEGRLWALPPAGPDEAP